MAIDPSALYGAHLPPSVLIYNALRDAGQRFSPSNPRIAALMRMAPALMQAFTLTQAQRPSLSGEDVTNPEEAVRQWFANAVGGGARSQIAGAYNQLPGLISNARAIAEQGPAGVENLQNQYLRALVQEATDPETVFDIFNTLQNPFVPSKVAQQAERGQALMMLGLYNRAGREGKDILDYVFGAPPQLAGIPEPAAAGGGGGAGALPSMPAPAELRPADTYRAPQAMPALGEGAQAALEAMGQAGGAVPGWTPETRQGLRIDPVPPPAVAPVAPVTPTPLPSPAEGYGWSAQTRQEMLDELRRRQGRTG